MIQIDKDVPLPPMNSNGKHAVKWPLSDMSIGDSFVFPASKSDSVATCAWRYKPKKFTIRKISDTECRIWRVE